MGQIDDTSVLQGPVSKIHYMFLYEMQKKNFKNSHGSTDPHDHRLAPPLVDPKFLKPKLCLL